MPEINFEEHCPCGNIMKISGDTRGGVANTEIDRWHRLHNKHANAISKAIVEARTKTPFHYSWPWTTTTLTTEQLPNTFTYNTSIEPQDKTDQ